MVAACELSSVEVRLYRDQLLISFARKQQMLNVYDQHPNHLLTHPPVWKSLLRLPFVQRYDFTAIYILKHIGANLAAGYVISPVLGHK